MVITQETIQAMDLLVTLIICGLISAAVIIKANENPEDDKEEEWWKK